MKLKKNIQYIVIITLILSIIIAGGMVDNLNCPTYYLIYPLIIVIINSIILIKWGKFDD